MIDRNEQQQRANKARAHLLERIRVITGGAEAPIITNEAPITKRKPAGRTRRKPTN